MNFLKVKKVNISEQIATKLIEMIISGEIKAGEKLPSERELAEKFGTNRNTLREALKILERDGLIDIRQGEGIEVLDFKKDGKINLLSVILKGTRDVNAKLDLLIDSLKIRAIGLAEISRIAAEKRGQHHIEEIERALKEIKENIGTQDNIKAYQLEMAFLRAIVKTTQSQVLIWFFNTIKEVIDDLFVEFGRFWNITEEYFESQRRIFEAIERGSAEDAYSATMSYFDALDKRLINLFKEVKNGQI